MSQTSSVLYDICRHPGPAESCHQPTLPQFRKINKSFLLIFLEKLCQMLSWGCKCVYSWRCILENSTGCDEPVDAHRCICDSLQDATRYCKAEGIQHTCCCIRYSVNNCRARYHSCTCKLNYGTCRSWQHLCCCNINGPANCRSTSTHMHTKCLVTKLTDLHCRSRQHNCCCRTNPHLCYLLNPVLATHEQRPSRQLRYLLFNTERIESYAMRADLLCSVLHQNVPVATVTAARLSSFAAR